MRVAVVAGPDAGHAIPAIALSLRLRDAGDEAVLFTGDRWRRQATAAGIDTRLLPGLAPRPEDDDLDAGARIHARAAHLATELLPSVRDLEPDLIVSDVLTAGGGLAAELLGIAWIELSPHPLYAPSRGLPPIGSGLARGEGVRGRVRDAVMRAATARSIAQGLKQRARARTGIGLPARDPGASARMIATLPALEVPRPDWPAATYLVGPLLWEPTDTVLAPPPGDLPLVLVAPSTAFTGAQGMVDAALVGLGGAGVRVMVSALDGVPGLHGENSASPLASAGLVSAGFGRQDAMLAEADVVVCGAGHGMLAKALLHGVPVVAVPGGGDQWELANRAARQGSAVVVRPVTPDALRDGVATVLGDARFRDAARRAAASAASVHDPVAVCRSVAG